MKGEESLQCKMRDRKGMPDEKLSAAIPLAMLGRMPQRKSDYDSRASLKQVHALDPSNLTKRPSSLFVLSFAFWPLTRRTGGQHGRYNHPRHQRV